MTMKPWARNDDTHALLTDLDQPIEELILSAAVRFDNQRADCCIAAAAYRVVLPADPGRPHPAELLFCGHHFRACGAGLQRASATAFDVDNHVCQFSG